MAAKQYGYVNSEYLAAAAELFAPIKTGSYRLMGELTGKTVLDIGCGSGVDTVAMARMVGGAGMVNGIDFDADMIQCANEYAKQTGLAWQIHHQCADACNLPFSSNSFHATRSERLFMHLENPQQALAEMVRVTKPGGQVVVIDTDWGSLSANTGADAIEHRLAVFRAEKFLPNGYSGRRLYGLMAATDLVNIQIETVALHTEDLQLWRFLTLTDRVSEVALKQGVISQHELDQWNHAMARCQQLNTFYGSVTIVIACGTCRA